MIEPRLFDCPIAGLYPIKIVEANALLVEWGHKLGPVNRPFRQEAFALEARGKPVAVAVSGSIVHGPVGAKRRRTRAAEILLLGEWEIPFPDRPEGFGIEEVVELTRLAACEPWANRVMLRIWREVCAPQWNCWPGRR